MPCGNDLLTASAASASTSVLSFETASIASTAAAGSSDKLATVCLPTVPSGLRNDRRNKDDSYSRVSPEATVCRLRTLTT
jgi:hypothetical protein